MFPIPGFADIVLIVIVVFVVFAAGKLPALVNTAGRALLRWREGRRGKTDGQ
ncbi:MAG: hypothetical protein DRI34_01045 [Deltaproteobacteria bacterium]|nr:MAG: hypothetical protein DRI34_01045 [Deltaproteobacteria bacterium]